MQHVSFIFQRTMCFNWVAAITVKLDKSSVAGVGYHLVAPLARELSLLSDGEPLRDIAKEAAHYIKNKLGHDEYNRLLNLATNKMDLKKAQRKTERAQMVFKFGYSLVIKSAKNFCL